MKYPTKTKCCALTVLLISALTANAKDAELPQTVVTATRSQARTDELLSDVSIITRDEIDQAGQNTLAELLAKQPGIEMAANGGPGSTTSVYIRGTNSGHALILLDGLRITSATIGATTLSRIPVEQIDHVEILRGPASALYGSDAIGGVIQIFTRQGTRTSPQITGSLGAGSYGTYEGTMGYAARLGDLNVALNLASYDSEGFSSIRNPSSSKYFKDKDGYHNDSVTGSIGYQLTPNHTVQGTFLYSTGINHYDAAGLTSPASYDYRDNHAVGAYGLNLRSHMSGDWLSTLRIGHSFDDSTDYTMSTQSFRFRTEQDQFTWQNDIKLPIGQALLAAEHLQEQVGPSASFAVTNRRIDSLLGGWSATLGSHLLQANLRRDLNSQYGGRTTGLLAYGYQFTSNWRTSLSYGSAFKAPAFDDLYFTGAGGINNPYLRPESARNSEAALHYETEGVHASATYYDNRIKDLINWAPTGQVDPWGFDIWAPSNVDRARIQGYTLAYSQRLDAWNFSASADFQNPENGKTGKQLEHRSKRHGSFSTDYNAGAWRFGAELTANGRRFDDAANIRAMGGYALLNLRANYTLDKNWSLFARVNNVFNRDYELIRSANFDGTINSYTVPKTSLFVGLRYGINR